MHFLKLPLLSLLCLGFIVFSCNKDGDTSKVEDTTLKIRLTDDPLDVEEVNVEITSLELQTDLVDPIIVDVEDRVYNLLDYQDSDVLLGQIDLGTATRLETVIMHLGANNTIVDEGVSYDLKTPGALQSGLKIKVNRDLAQLADYDLLLDFDAAKSVICTGNSKFLLKPVIIVIKEDAMNDEDDDDEDDEDDEDECDEIEMTEADLTGSILDWIAASEYAVLAIDEIEAEVCPDGTGEIEVEFEDGPTAIFDLEGNHLRTEE